MPKGRQDPARCQNAKEIAAKCYFLLDFYEEVYDDSQYTRIASLKRHGLAKALAACHVPALTMAYRDLRGAMDDLGPGDRAEIIHQLDVLFASDLDTEIRDEILRVQEIVQRRQIANDDEYGVLRAYLDHHIERWGRAVLTNRATEMVAEYENRIE